MLSRYDPWGYRGVTPFAGGLGGGLLDTFFGDDDFTPRIRDHAGQLQIKDNGDFEYKVDCGGFRPEEIQVNLEGDEVLIAAKHDERREGEAVHREFTRRVRIPQGIQKETIRCDLDPQGRLHVLGHTQALEGQTRRQIPIGYRRGERGQSSSGQAGQGILENNRAGDQTSGAGAQGGNIGGDIGQRSANQQQAQAGRR